MPVYLFTYHAYGSWLPDRPQGFVQENRGIQPTNTTLATTYKKAMTYPAVVFEQDTQQCLIKKLLAIAESESYRLHGVASEPTHLHALVSWQEISLSCNKVRGRIKNLLSLDLSRKAETTGRPWFSQGASRKRVKDRQHLEYLLTSYLPKHRGVQWYEDRGWVN